MNVKVKRENGKLKIYMHELIHVMIDENLSPVITLQAYQWTERSEYWIEYRTGDGKLFKTMYHNRETWSTILTELDKIYK